MTNVTVSLAPLDSTDIGLARAWRNDYRIMRWTRQSDFISDAEQVAWFNKQKDDPTIRMYKVVAQAPGDKIKMVGVAGFTSIDWRNRRAEFSLYIAPDLHRRGLGKVALSVLLTHGFENLGLSQIWGETFVGNPAFRMFKELGMRLDGTRRAFYFKDGVWLDAYLVSILEEEWRAHRLAMLASATACDGHPSVEISEAAVSDSGATASISH